MYPHGDTVTLSHITFQDSNLYMPSQPKDEVSTKKTLHFFQQFYYWLSSWDYSYPVVYVSGIKEMSNNVIF